MQEVREVLRLIHAGVSKARGGALHRPGVIDGAHDDRSFPVAGVDRKRSGEALQIVCAQTWEHR
jgi:hypothetical protein